MSKIFNKSLVWFHKLGTFKNIKDFDDLESRISNLGEKDLLPSQKKLLKSICIEDSQAYTKKRQGMINNLVGDAGAIIGLADKILSNDKKVVPSEKIPPNIKRKYSMALGIPDGGTDGYAIDSQVKCDKAIQFKWFSHGENVTLGVRQLSTFFSDAENFPLREIYTNAKAVSKRLSNKTRIKVTTHKDLKKRWTPKRLKSLEKLVAGSMPVKNNAHALKDHQKRALNDIAKGFKTNNRGQYISACGTGKTFTYVRLRERLKSKKTVVLVPSIALAGQLLEEFTTHGRHNKDLTFSVVCSDPSIASELDAMTFESTELDYHITTNHAELEQRDKESKEHLVICTYHSVPVLTKSKIDFELGIFDEAHRTTGNIGDYFSLALSDDNVKIKKRLFATATPKFIVATKTNITNSMDNEDIYGKVFHRLSNSEAVEAGLIVPIKIITAAITKDDLNRELIKRGKTYIDKVGNVKTNHIANILAFEKAAKKYNLKKTFIYNSTITAARMLAEDEELGAYAFLSGVDCFHINGDIRSYQRSNIVDSFRESKNALITNVRCLVEGVDLPAVDCVAFFDPRKSVIDIVQAVGRPARVDGKKECGYVFVPIYIDFNKDEDAGTAAYDSSYDVLFDVICALAEHDDSLQQKLTELQRTLGEGEGKGPAIRTLSDIFETVGLDPVSLESLKRSISTNLLEIFQTKRYKGGHWERFIGTLTKVKKDTGDCNTYDHPIFSDKKFLKSIKSSKSNARHLYKKNLLLSERVKQLNDLGFIWSVLDAEFEENFCKLKEFKKEHGHCNVPETRVNKDGTGPRTKEGKLGTWCSVQRKRRKDGTMSDDEINKLDSIDFDWNPLASVWDKRCGELEEFKKEFGHTLVPSNYKNKKLYIWTGVQRNGSLGRIVKDKSKLSKAKRLRERQLEKIKRLDSIDFIWDSKRYKYELKFKEAFKELKQYKEETGDFAVSEEFRKTDKGYRLVSFMNTVRTRFKQNAHKSNLSPFSQKHIDALNSIGFPWVPTKDSWHIQLEELIDFKEKHGHYNVPAKQRKLCSWVYVQRRQYRAGTLPKERVKKLNSINFNWENEYKKDLLQKKFDTIQRIKKHEEKYGNLNVTAEANKKLRRQFDLDKKLLFELRRQVDGKAEKKEDTDILVAEVDKQLKTWTWDTEKIPEIKKVRTKTRKETYSVTITINKKTRVYRRQDPKLLEEMRDEVLKAGKHIKFPRPVRKGKDAPSWGRKKYIWTKDETKILKKNWKSMTDEQISKLLKTQSAFSVKLQRQRLGLIKSFALCTGLRGEQKVLQKTCPKTGRFVKSKKTN